MLEIELEGEKIALLPERALYWPAQHTLIVADLHWGKAGHFRKNGIAIPAQAQQRSAYALQLHRRRPQARPQLLAEAQG